MGEHNKDFALALQLQAEFDAENSGGASVVPGSSYNAQDDQKRTTKNSNSELGDSQSWTLVDPRWEIIDPIPDVRALFLEFNNKYFWGRLAGIEIRWSPRMTLCAGLCVYEGKMGLCSVRLSEPLLKLRPRKDLIETLLHEMIHAYLFVTDNNKDHDGHGPEFHKHMYRLNNETGTNISVYHTFHDEVDSYRTHWWKCDGPCVKKPPYFGMVKRAMNRAPSPRDPWWNDHKQSCGGTYTKFKEPEGYGEKKSKKSDKQEKKDDYKPKGNMDIRNFGGMGKAGDPSKKTGPSKHSTSGANQPTLKKTGSNSSTGGPSNEPFANSSAKSMDPKSLYDVGIGKNVHGFGGEQKTLSEPGLPSGTVKKNIHGFGKNLDQDDDSSSQGSSSISGYFPGAGKTLSKTTASSSGEMPSGPIVRRIPGIGVISSERHNLASSNDGRANNKVVIDYKSDESDFDSILDDLLKPPSKKKSLLKESSKVGEIKRIPGFTSVSNPRRLSDPGTRYDRNKGKGLSLVDRRSEGNLTRYKNSKGQKRKISSDDSLALDRNKRACCFTSSESDTDSDDNIKLGAVAKKRLEKTEVKPKKGDSDSDDDLSILQTNVAKSNRLNDVSNGANPFPRVKAGGIVKNSRDSSSPPPSPHPFSSPSPPRRGVSPPPPMGSPPPPPNPNAGHDPIINCPVCQVKIAQSKINEHLDDCLTMMCL